MNIKMIIYPAMVGILSIGCGGSDKSSYSEAVENEVAVGGENEDLNNMQDEKPLGQHQLSDTLELPDPLMIILNKNPETSLDKIKSVRRYTEQATDYYEITFNNPVNEKRVITYDNLGKVKSPDLDSIRKDNVLPNG